MATDGYICTDLEDGKRAAPGAGFPGQVFSLRGTYEKTAADTNGSIRRFGKIPANAIPLYSTSKFYCDAIAGFTDGDIGVYKTLASGGDVVDKDILLDGLDPHSGFALGSGTAAFAAVGIDEFGLSVKEMVDAAAGTTSHDEEYDLALTLNTGGTATGTIAWEFYFTLPQA